jgi:hypothetical protein
MLSLVWSAVRLLGARAAVQAALQRLVRLAALLLVALASLAAAAGFGLYAAYAWLATLLPPPAAAGICAGALVLLAAIAAAAALWRPGAPARRPRIAPSDLPPEAAGILEWGRANPLQAVAAALLLGFLAGRRRR